ncbi:predicted protein, partial [Nematostella vectensis]
MVAISCKFTYRTTSYFTQKEEHPVLTIQSRAKTSTPQDPTVVGLPLVMELHTSQGLSASASEVILWGWRSGTQKQYHSYLERWNVYCSQWEINPLSASVIDGLNFLGVLYEEQLQYSTINTARSALSSVIFPPGG